MDGEQKEASRFPWPFVAGTIVVLLIAGIVYAISLATKTSGISGEQHLPFGLAEQAAAERIHFSNPEMARAANFLNQEFTTVAGVIENDGVKTIHGLELTMEFHDPFNQVILRETARVISLNARPLLGGERRSFQVTLEHIPVEWDQRYPQIRVTGLVVE